MAVLADYIESKSIPEALTGCWLWTGSVDDGGYGRINKKTWGDRRVHRLSYRAYLGEIPQGMLVLHRCDVPSCCNPNHLFLGSYDDNNKDRVKKNRSVHVYGESHKSSKLTADQVSEIKESKLSGISLATKFNVSNSIISRIRLGKVWRHIWQS